MSGSYYSLASDDVFHHIISLIGINEATVNAESTGEYIALVVRLQANADGDWYVSIDGTTTLDSLPLRPLALVVRLWRATDTGILRGNIRLLESDQWVPIQSNAQLAELVCAWLLASDTTTGIE